ncbi:N-formylglutamate amidohydrolase [Devosia sp. XJ19-1]|uniref:N-formylglutamate amidohydrolase n=1 Tax=Devosia ureilytica TaxID=2952754 RepID=A0A9Q4ASE6_9HYPH|nr:N-formylglutamate amidohydrolase [Devosia ureilytica]MCP8885325.1 N-formylglutamate amidohydrolase [Devosia ureilytica]MCP8888783.1 N-formylglutamate amidohydrolase [Devosia ureilytica]
MHAAGENPVLVSNAEGTSPFVLVCDHASRRIPARYGDMGLSEAERVSHIAWDPGALAVCQSLSTLLDAPLVESTVSRLVIDANRDLDAPDLIWTLSEATHIPANEGLSAQERQFRIETYHRPYHDAVETVLNQRDAAGRETTLVCMHSFTPVFLGQHRPWPIGLIHGKDLTFTRALQGALAADDPSLNIGWNEPYAALNGVTLTLEKHGDGRGIAATMIEIRNDEIGTAAGVTLWAERLARSLERARQEIKGL